MRTFGLGMVTAQHDPRDKRTDFDIYQAVLDLAVEAERLGFDAIWLSEHHFVDDGYMPSLLPVCAAISARTKTIQLGTGILLAPFYNPLRLAEDAATVDILSEGRLILGLGAGYRAEEFAGFGVPSVRPGARVEATVGTLRGSWSSGLVRSEESAALVSVTPKPHRPHGPPIWLGTRNPVGLRRAARIADGFIAARVSPSEFEQQVTMFRHELENAGRAATDATVSVHCPVFAWPEAGGWEKVRDHLHYSEWKYQDMVREPYGGRARVARPPRLSGAKEAELKETALVGSPIEVAHSIRAYCDAAGTGNVHFIARLYWPGMDASLQREAIAVFAEQVLPEIAGS